MPRKKKDSPTKAPPKDAIPINRDAVVAAAAPIYAFLRYGVQPVNMNRNDMHEDAIRQALELMITFDSLGQQLLNESVANVQKLQEERKAELKDKAEVREARDKARNTMKVVL